MRSCAIDRGRLGLNNLIMRTTFLALGLLVASVLHAAEPPAPAEKGFVVQEVRVGQTAFKLPLPKGFVAVGRDEDWAKAFYARVENLGADPRGWVSFVFASLTPEHLARCRQAKVLNTGLDCWGTVQNKTAEREIDLATFNQIVDAVTAEFDKNGLDDIRKSIRREVKDEEYSRILGALGRPMIVDRNERSLQFIMTSGSKYILGGFVLIEGKLFNIYLQRPKSEVRELIVMMDDWVAEISRTTKATRK